MRESTKARYPKNWRKISRETIIERGKVCESCGKGWKDNVVLVVHHIDYDPANCEDVNKIVLCQGCHFRRQAWEKKYGRPGNGQLEFRLRG